MDNQKLSENKTKVRSKISDEELARLIEDDCKKNPSSYSSGPIDSDESIPNSNYFFKHTSACGIEQIVKWL